MIDLWNSDDAERGATPRPSAPLSLLMDIYNPKKRGFA